MSMFYKSVSALLVTVAAATAFAQHPDHDDGPKLSSSEKAERRTEIMQMAKDTIAELRNDANARDLLDKAYGEAVFDTTKGGLIVTGAGGTGVAMRKNGGQPVYMHLGEGGVGLGAGLENTSSCCCSRTKRSTTSSSRARGAPVLRRKPQPARAAPVPSPSSITASRSTTSRTRA